jgi:hypothetical protein
MNVAPITADDWTFEIIKSEAIDQEVQTEITAD